MKKIIASFCMVFFLFSCSQVEVVEDEEKNTKDEKEVVQEEVRTIEDLSDEEVQEMREEIDFNAIDKLFAGEEVTELTENIVFGEAKEFLEAMNEQKEYSTAQKIEGGVSFEVYQNEVQKLSEVAKREIYVDLDIIHYKTNAPISEGTVYINGVNMGTFENGKFSKEIEWPIGIEFFKIMVRAPEYGDAFIANNLMNFKGKLLRGTVLMKPYDVDTRIDITEGVSFENEDIAMTAKPCTLVDGDGRCFKGEVNLKINSITGVEANNGEVSLNMMGLTKEGELIYLRSGGMAFIEFSTDEGDILNIGEGKSMRITYQETPEDTRTMTNLNKLEEGTDNNAGYWLYDRDKQIWLEMDAQDIVRDTKNHTWSATVSKIY